MRKTVIGIVLIFLPVVAQAQDVTIGVPERAQEHSEWCWAGTSEATLDYYGTTVAQCEIANWAWVRVDCCASEPFFWNHPCNQPNAMWGGRSLRAILRNWGVSSNVVMSALAWPTVQAEIDARRPFIMRFQWASGGGHFLAGYGYDPVNNTVHYMDPWPGNGFTESNYNWTVNAPGNHSWTHTLQLTTTPQNQPPSCDAGGPYAAELGNPVSAVQLDGSGSRDPDPGGTLSYWWSADCPGAQFSDASSMSPLLTTSTAGTCSLDCSATLTVRDSAGASASCSASVAIRDTIPPSIVCPPNMIVECEAAGQATVAMSSASTADLCGGPVAVVNSHTPNGRDASGSYPLGSTVVEFTASDTSGNVSSCDTVVTVVDTTPPAITAPALVPNSLWPPNHTMSDVRANYTAADSCSSVVCSLSVSSNEPVDDLGDGDTAPDWIILDDHSLKLRAERAGSGTGRTYKSSLACSDVFHNTSNASLPDVHVMHDMRGPASGSAYKINTPVNFAGTFWDMPGRTHVAQWILDDISSLGTINEPTASRPGLVHGTYSFGSTGIYAVKMNVTDAGGNTGTADAVGGVDAVVVIYDPSGGYVTGGGWVDSPPGAYSADPGLIGKVNFGFVSKYFKNATHPKGETEVDFRLAGFKFNALNFDYLMISGAKAMYKGFGKVNGEAGYSFVLTVIDGQAIDGGGVDKFRIKIWNKTTGAVVYDNQMGAPDNADPITIVGAGSVVIQP